MLYFAYGSNMSISRLRRRAPGALRLGLCVLRSHDLRFHKESEDGSGKCDAFLTGNATDSVYGSLFEIGLAEKLSLDLVEGLGSGYDEKKVSLINVSGETVDAVTYYAREIDETLKPYSWYMNHVLMGAYESNCPPGYVARIESIQSMEDKDFDRDARERAIHRQTRN
jgi:gamma-glutamylcyclotransferase